jgi:hypothetical protein
MLFGGTDTSSSVGETWGTPFTGLGECSQPRCSVGLKHLTQIRGAEGATTWIAESRVAKDKREDHYGGYGWPVDKTPITEGTKDQKG